jgi:Recombinase
MTTRLYCHECGWNHSYRTRRNARRAAGRHACATAPHLQTTAPWWLRFWMRLPRRRSAGFDAPNLVGTGTEVVRTYSDRIQAAVLAAHHAETTQRARRAMVELVRAGYQIGPAPYGYHTLRIRVTDTTGHARFRVVLVPDWHTASVVTQIFYWRADQGLGFRAIARRLNAEPRRYPSPSRSGPWTPGAVRRVVTNPRYTGRQVWARTVAGRPAPVEQWVTSAPMVHEPLIDDRTFHRARPRTAGQPGPNESTGAA